MSAENKTQKFEMPMIIGISLILLGILFLSVLLGVTIGSVDISMKDVYQILAYKLLGLGSGETLGQGPMHDIVWYIRLPRIILAILIGIGLSISGATMQAIVKNPLADPYILGISSGATFGATLAIVLGVGKAFGANSVGICAFLGALLASLAVLTLANIKGRPNASKLILAGMALSTVFSAFSSFLVYMAEDREAIKNISYWLMGSLAGAKWEIIGIMTPIILIAFVFFISQYRTLNMMLLGDEVAVTLGKNLHTYRQIYLIIISVLVGFMVYAAGMIGFVGLIIPHLIRMVFGTDHRRVIVLSGLFGGIFLIWADVLARIIVKGSELPIGVLVSMIGAPLFIYLMISKSYGFGGNNE